MLLNILSSIGTAVAALIAAYVWWEGWRLRRRAQAEAVTMWPADVRPVSDEGRVNYAERLFGGVVIRNGSTAPVRKVGFWFGDDPVVGLPVLAPGTYIVWKNPHGDGWLGPQKVNSGDGLDRIVLATESDTTGDFDLSPPTSAVSGQDVPEIDRYRVSFLDDSGRAWERSPALIKSRDRTVGWDTFKALPPSPDLPQEALQAAVSDLDQSRKVVQQEMGDLAKRCSAPASRVVPGSASEPNEELRDLGIAQIFLQGGRGLGLQLRTANDSKSNLYYFAGSSDGRLAAEFWYGSIEGNHKERQLRGALPASIKALPVGNRPTGKEVYDALLAALRADRAGRAHHALTP